VFYICWADLFKNNNNNNNRTKITLCWADLFLFELICCCNSIFGLLRILLAFFLCYLVVCYVW
jgi:hypothetical protein